MAEVPTQTKYMIFTSSRRSLSSDSESDNREPGYSLGLLRLAVRVTEPAGRAVGGRSAGLSPPAGFRSFAKPVKISIDANYDSYTYFQTRKMKVGCEKAKLVKVHDPLRNLLSDLLTFRHGRYGRSSDSDKVRIR